MQHALNTGRPVHLSRFSFPSLLGSACLESTWLGTGSNFYENVACSVCSKALPSCQRQHHTTHTHTQTHIQQQPPAHAHLHSQERLAQHCTPGWMALRQGRDSYSTAARTEPELESVHCADLQRNEICFIMQNANTPTCTRTKSVSSVSTVHITHTPRALLCHKKCRQQTTV